MDSEKHLCLFQASYCSKQEKLDDKSIGIGFNFYSGFNTHFGSLAKRRLVRTSSITWNCREVIVAVILCELKVSSFSGFTCKVTGIRF